jgi:hypothetical protein
MEQLFLARSRHDGVDPTTDTPGYRFRCEGEYWTIEYDGSLCRLRDTRGLRYLARLLAQPGTGIPATDLAAAGTRVRTAEAARTNGDTAAPAPDREHARIAVSRCIQSAMARIAGAHPTLARHLEVTIRRGYVCSYCPDPRVPIRWET